MDQGKTISLEVFRYLPEGDAARAVQAFVRRGGQALFLPPRSPGEQAFLGVRWGGWAEGRADTAVETWRGDQDLLANTLSGAALASSGSAAALPLKLLMN